MDPNASKGGSPLPPDWTQLLGFNFRKIRWVLLALVLLVVGGWLIYPVYLERQEHQLVQHARDFLQHSDWRSAVVSARQALQLDKTNIEATRIMAEMAEAANSPAAPLWRGRVAELEPNRNSNYLAWAGSALHSGDLFSAQQALARVDQAGRKTVDFNRMAASLAISENDYSVAERFLARVAAQETNDLNELNLATVRLFSTRPEKAREAVAAIERLRAEPRFSLVATRALLDYTVRQKDVPRAVLLAHSLTGMPGATFRDHLQLLDTLYLAQDPEWRAGLAALQKQAGTKPDRVFDLVDWMNAHGLADSARGWVAGFPAEAREMLPIPLAVAESNLLMKDWPRLKRELEGAYWHELEFIRLAILSRTLREIGMVVESRQQWRSAVRQVSGNSDAAAMLARMTARWNWKIETEELWWDLAKGRTRQRPALAALERVYLDYHDTRQLLRVYQRILELNPDDLVARNNVAMVSLLLGRDLAWASDLARRNYLKATNNAAFVSTYAFALYANGQTREAAQLLGSLPQKQLEQPSFAAYYGVFLAGAGESARARHFLDLAGAKPEKLLMEEQNMVTNARRLLKQP